MKLKIPLVLLSAVVLSACSKKYDYAGSFELTKGDDCVNEKGNITFITIFQSSEGESTYTARLSSLMSRGGTFPVESKPSKVNEDGSITFLFFKEGKSGLFSGHPAIDMKMKVKQKDLNYIYIESWNVVISSPVRSAYKSSVDLIKDHQISMMGRKAPNEISTLSGKNGLCLEKIKI